MSLGMFASARRGLVAGVLLAGLLAGQAWAEPILGTWVSPPDHKGQIGHVVARKCGALYCGKLERAFDKAGKPTITPNVGKMLFWDMRPTGSGAYSGGKAYVPVFSSNFDADIKVTGDRLKISGCVKVLCKSQVWTRLR